MGIRLIDLQFQGRPGTIGAYLVETSEGPVLVESGPASTLAALEDGLRQLGYGLEEVGHVLLTHIHFDHAGGAWRLAELGAKVHVHPFGMRHLADPTILWQSAQRIFGGNMERLWGEMRGIGEDRLVPCGDGERLVVGEHAFRSWHTPGHAKHHVAWELEGAGAVFTGDVAGVALSGGPVVAPCPPPDIDLPAWKASLDRLRGLAAKTYYLTHFGSVEARSGHLRALEAVLEDWRAWVEARLGAGGSADRLVEDFQKYVEDGLEKAGVDAEKRADYELANPAFMSVHGLARYLQRAQG